MDEIVHTGEKEQSAVDAMAKVLGVAETAIERAMMATGAIPKGIRDFHYAVGTHVTYTAEAQHLIGGALENLGSALANVALAHQSLDELRIRKGLPQPGAVALNGGGNGKP